MDDRRSEIEDEARGKRVIRGLVRVSGMGVEGELERFE